MTVTLYHVLYRYKDILCKNALLMYKYSHRFGQTNKVLLASQYGTHSMVFWVYPLLFKICFVSFTAHHSSNENAHKDRLCGCCPRAIRYSGCPHTNNHNASLRVSHIPASVSYPSFGTIKRGGLI